jgi:hypothetical protein
MAITTISTSQAPDAKPVAVNKSLSVNWQELVNVPNYEVPELVFGGSTTVEPGVGEIISPLICCNTTANTATVDVQVFRFDLTQTFWIIRNLQVPGYETIPIPLNGQFLKSGDILEAKSDANNAIDVTMSFTLGQSEEDDVV